MKMRLHHRPSRESGAAMVELVISLPMLLAVLIGAADFARVFYASIQLTNAARAGAQYGARSLGDSADIPGMEAAATSSVNIPGVTAVASRVCQCAQADGTFPDTVDCTVDPEAACPSPKFRVITVTVTASKTFNTITPYPGIPGSLPLTRMAVLRVTE